MHSATLFASQHVITFLFIFICLSCRCPISGLHGSNLQERMDEDVCSCWIGACLFEALDAIDIPPHDPKAPLRYTLSFMVFTLCDQSLNGGFFWFWFPFQGYERLYIF